MAEVETWMQDQNNSREDYSGNEGYQQKFSLKRIICLKPVKGGIFLTLFAVSVPILVYYFIIDQGTYKITEFYTCSVKTTFRVTCGEVNITSSDCEKLQCCFERSSRWCYHYLPSKYSYGLDEETNEYVAAQINGTYGTPSVTKLQISVNEISKDKVGIVLHEPSINVEANTINDDKNYNVKLVEEILMVEIYRSNSEDLLLSTTKGPLIVSDGYWEWTLYLTNHSLFGLNQTLISMDENVTTSKVIYKNKDDHYTFPVFWAYNNNQFHGVVIKHDGPLEITILPSNLIILRGLTGEKIELELSVGPTPKHLHDQQSNSYGLPPYWALETYMCRRGDNVNLTELIRDYNLDDQVDSDCIHENLLTAIMDDNGVNIEGLRNLLSQIKDQGIKFLLPVPPYVFGNTSVLYEKANSLNILYKYNQEVYKGKYLSGNVVYPDYSHPAMQSYMDEFNALLTTYMDISDIDGFVLYDNWPANENYEMDNTSFPYLPEELRKAMSYTLPWDATINNGSTLHIQKHNAYGSAQFESISSYYNSTRPELFIMSASKVFGQVQPSIIQNINPSWTNLQEHLDNVLFNSIIGNHLVSTPVCGDTDIFDNTVQETLCIRWYLVAATMPLFRIESVRPWRDPKNLNTVFAEKSATTALEVRRMLTSYYYTLLSKNEPIVRPMFYDFYEDVTTFSLDGQYMIGENILVAHPFTIGRRKLQIYFPNVIGIWYEFWGGGIYNSTDNPWIDVDVVETDFVAFISQGTVLPLKVDNNLDLIIALNCTSDPCEAYGTLFEGSYLDFVADVAAVTVSGIPQQSCNYTLGNIRLYYYANATNAVKYYSKQEDLCTGEDSITLSFESQPEDEDETPTTDE